VAAGGRGLMASHPGRYAELLSHTPDSVDLEIMRDLNRTFPNHVFFHQVRACVWVGACWCG
jgi:hypothetical protein